MLKYCTLLLCLSGFLNGQCPGNRYNNNQEKGTSTCTVWGSYNVKTFDDHGLNFKSDCMFTMTSFTFENHEFKVNIGRNDRNCRKLKTGCYIFVNISYRKVAYALFLNDDGSPSLTIAKTVTGIPFEDKEIRVSQFQGIISINFLNLDVVLKWNAQAVVQIAIENGRKHQTLGLCGNNDKCSTNDQMLNNQITEQDLRLFLQEWQPDKQSCRGAVDTTPKCADRQRAINDCRILRGGKFVDANKILDPELYIEACIWNHCFCREQQHITCMCDTFDAYAKSSINAGVPRIAWRDDATCPKSCTGDLQFYSCPPTKGVQTCDGSTVRTKDQKCEEGCYCQVATYAFGDKCFLRKKCPCLYNGKVHQPGDSFWIECNICTCNNGKIDCTKDTCYNGTSICFGDPHYETWDGKFYHFMGKCAYYLIKGKDFSIEADHYVYKNDQFVKENSTAPSYAAVIFVRVPGLVVELRRDFVVFANGKRVTRYPLTMANTIISKPSSTYVLVELPNKIQMVKDHFALTQFRIPITMAGKVAGLMGTYTEDPSDDFLTPNGEILDDPTAFGNSWKTDFTCQDHSQTPTHPCDVNPGGRAPAQEACSIIKSALFEPCNVKETARYFDSCVYDTCNCPDNPIQCTCDVIAAFALECTKKGIVVDWRNEMSQCRIECPAGQVYQECANMCETSCEDISLRPDCQKVCIQGCNCAPGTTLNEDGKCIPIEKCNCRINGIIYPPGYQILENIDEVITCTNGRWITAVPIEEQPLPPTTDELNGECDVDHFFVYTPCRYDPPLTCQNMHTFEVTAINRCQKGCECMEGYVFDLPTKTCVKPENCPCLQNGQSYKEASVVVQEGCNKCACSNGAWKCNEEDCSKNECINEGEVKIEQYGKCVCKKGVWQCIDGQCDIWGNSYIQTFDQKRYDFQGVCAYVLAKGKINDDEFKVHFTNEICSHTGAACLKSISITVNMGGVEESVTLVKHTNLPNAENLKNIVLSDKHLLVEVEVVKAGIRVFWDKSTWLYIQLDHRWQQKVTGLCGDFNQKEGDDMYVTDNAILPFVDTWRVDDKCEEAKPNTNSYDETRFKWAQEQCSILVSGIFAPCHRKVPVEYYYEACVMDSSKCDIGGDCECPCTAIAAYAQQCNNYGVPIKWRSQELCPIQCSGNTEYQPCVSTCPPRTCEILRKGLTIECEKEICKEDCGPKPLPTGHVYVDSTFQKSVPEGACKFQCNLRGNIYHERDVTEQTDCKLCVCSKGDEVCTDLPCGTTTALPITDAVTWPTVISVTPPPCNKDECKPTRCPLSTKEVEIAGQCCKSCQHKTKCLIYSQHAKKLGRRKPGKIWNDGPCMECTCVGNEDYNHCAQCKKKICAETTATNITTEDTYYEITKGPCCPAMEALACVHNKIVYKIGDVWEVDECKQGRCVKDPASGLPVKQEISEYCNEVCPFGYIYKKSDNACCGQCVQESCVFKKKARKLGKRWHSKDKCTDYSCELVEGRYTVSSYKIICPPVVNCAGTVKKVGCCEFCTVSELFVWQNEPPNCNYSPVI